MPDDNDFDPDGSDPEESSVIRSLRADLKKAKADATEVSSLRQELAISKAGIDLSPVQLKALAATHEGEWTSEGIKATATELGFVKAESEAPPEPQVPADEQQALQQQQEATAAAEAVDAKPTPLDDQIANAKSPAELRQIVEGAGVGWNAAEF